METRRVVITGMGLVSSLGLNVADNWTAILAGKSGITKIIGFDTSELSCKIASIIKEFNPENYMAARDVHKMDKFMHFGIAAAAEAINDANWHPEDQENKDRTGVLLGSGIGGLGTIENTSADFHAHKLTKVSPYYIPASLVNLLAGHVSIKYGFSGPNSAVSTACTTSTHAIGDAARIIKYGDAEVMIAGGSEAPITPTGVAGFAAAKALATNYNNEPTAASRPWDVDRCGFVMGEGAGVLVLEEYGHAVNRGAKIYAELIGYGLTADAYHITSPNGRGAYRAMENAIKDGRITPEEINYINAHGTSTKLGDTVELEAVQNLFQNNHNLKMSSTKSSTGHLLGAAGAAEAIFTLLAIRDQIAPPTLNLHNPVKEAKIDLVPLYPKAVRINYALSNSFGFGGTNASLLFKKI